MATAVALAVAAARPTARAAHAFLELLPGAADTALVGCGFLRILDPADELVTGEGRDVEPGGERLPAAGEPLTKVGGQVVDDAAGKFRRSARSGHAPRLPSERRALAIGARPPARLAPMPIRAVTFDFWNTIAAEPAHGEMREARHAAVLAACESLGMEHTAERIGPPAEEVIRAREASWAEGIHLSPAEGAERLVDALEVEPTLAPAIGATLEHLTDDGLALGIVCDAGFTGGAILRSFLADRGLLPHFSGWGFSDEVGAYKPAPAIFAAALGALGTEPAEAIHVGDLRRTDIAGARAMGMRSVRYRGLADDPGPGPEADFVIDDHRELVGLIAGLDRTATEGRGPCPNGARLAAPVPYSRPLDRTDRRSVAAERFPAFEFVVDQSFEDGRAGTQRQRTATCFLLRFAECEGLHFCQCPCFVRGGCVVVVDRFPAGGAFDRHPDFGDRAER